MTPFLDPYPIPFSDPLKIEEFFKASKGPLGPVAFLIAEI